MHLNELARAMRTAGEERRLHILCHLMKSGQLCVSEIARDLHMSVATTSHHLQVMAKDELVIPIRKGKYICYKLPRTALMSGLKKFICTQRKI
ncbi:MAG: Transcriptional regulator, ArsR family [Parcubacteria group bacterium GW2011_GWA2_47_7]|nr:MAG: Transcriptional regulator, ArsR family [Parcubacteria group bacterium GW2011_GWA2_47_7]